MDDDMSGSIEINEFKKAISDFRIDLNEEEAQMVFGAFDRDGSGSIDYDEFVRGVRGPMNGSRKKIVGQAFKKIDKDGSGVLDINDIKDSYNAKMHPDVKAGKKTEEEILGEFLETFEAHHSMNGAGVRDQSVTVAEFEEYYNNISASIDRDDYFELMMINAWKLYGEAPRKPAWSNLSGKSQMLKDGFSVHSTAPFGVDNNKVDYSTHLRPKGGAGGSQPMPPAGSSSWPEAKGGITGNSRAMHAPRAQQELGSLQ